MIHTKSQLADLPLPRRWMLVTVMMLSCVLSATHVLAQADQSQWSRFRGPNGSGLAETQKLPTEIGDPQIAWKKKLLGSGSSSPVVWQDLVFVTSFDDQSNELVLECVSLSKGTQKWAKRFAAKPYRVHSRNSIASSTPVVGQDAVYITFANPGSTKLVAVSHEGQTQWTRDFGTWQSQHGYGASPILIDDKVVLFNSQQAEKLRPGTPAGQSRMIAVNAKDGTDAWTTNLTTTRACYAVPTLVELDGKKRIITCNTGDGFFAINPTDGSMSWKALPFRMRTVASMLFADGMLFGSCGSGGGGNYLVAAKLDSLDKAPQQAYKVVKANYVPSPIVVDSKLFLFTDKGISRCFEAKSGQLLWEKRLGSGFSGSPVAANGHIYIMDESGTLYTMPVDAKGKSMKYDLGEDSRATPAIAGDRMLLRTESQLICVADK